MGRLWGTGPAGDDTSCYGFKLPAAQRCARQEREEKSGCGPLIPQVTWEKAVPGGRGLSTRLGQGFRNSQQEIACGLRSLLNLSLVLWLTVAQAGRGGPLSAQGREAIDGSKEPDIRFAGCEV